MIIQGEINYKKIMGEIGKLPFKERRRHPRKKVTVEMSYSIISSNNGVGVMRNISEGGFCFLTDKFLAPGLLIKANFTLPQEKDPIQVIGRVIWCKLTEDGYRVGVKVLD